MTMSEMNYYKFCMKEPLPEWVRSERYEYCDSFDYRMLRARPVEKKTSFLHSIISQISA